MKKLIILVVLIMLPGIAWAQYNRYQQQQLMNQQYMQQQQDYYQQQQLLNQRQALRNQEQMIYEMQMNRYPQRQPMVADPAGSFMEGWRQGQGMR